MQKSALITKMMFLASSKAPMNRNVLSRIFTLRNHQFSSKINLHKYDSQKCIKEHTIKDYRNTLFYLRFCQVPLLWAISLMPCHTQRAQTQRFRITVHIFYVFAPFFKQLNAIAKSLLRLAGKLISII